MSVACLVLVVLLALCPSPAWAVPGPMSPADLVAASDLVALIRVLSVTCLEVWRHGGTGEELASFEARLGVLRVTKGQARRYQTVRLAWEEVSSQTLGNWCVRYYPGEELWTHLKIQEHDGAYKSTWWNARGEQIRPPDRTTLPWGRGRTSSASFRAQLPFRIVECIKSLRGRLHSAQ